MLLDLAMPGMDGIEVARTTRADPELQALQIVAMSGWTDQAHLQLSKEAGCEAYLIKPFTINEFQASVLPISQA